MLYKQESYSGSPLLLDELPHSCTRKSDLTWQLIVPCIFYKNPTAPGYVCETAISDLDVSENILGS